MQVKFSDNFTFEVKDSTNATDTAVVTLTVVGSNDSPVAIAGSGSSITEDSPGNITLSATDIDIGDNLTYTLVSQPSYGNVSTFRTTRSCSLRLTILVQVQVFQTISHLRWKDIDAGK